MIYTYFIEQPSGKGNTLAPDVEGPPAGLGVLGHPDGDAPLLPSRRRRRAPLSLRPPLLLVRASYVVVVRVFILVLPRITSPRFKEFF